MIICDRPPQITLSILPTDFSHSPIFIVESHHTDTDSTIKYSIETGVDKGNSILWKGFVIMIPSHNQQQKNP